MTKTKIYPLENLAKESKALFDILNKESELAMVLIGTSFLDNCLVSQLKNYFIKTSVSEKLLGHTGAIGTFAARTDLARCLDIIDKTIYQDLNLIGEIRNIFGHSHLTMGFNDKKVQLKCDCMQYAKQMLSFNNNLTELGSPKNIFCSTVALLSQKLLMGSKS